MKKKQSELETLCRHLIIARSHKKTEEKYNLSDADTIKYKRMGCYKCNGYIVACPNYR